MNTLAINLKEAYETSTKQNNSFAALVNTIDWDAVYTSEDGDTYFEKDDIVLTVFSLDPFEPVPAAPSVWNTADNTGIYF